MHHVTMPRWVVGLICLDVGLTLLYLVDYALGRPFDHFSRFIDLDGEANLPTWWSSIQWFCVAAAFWVFAIRTVDRRPSRSWLLLILPAVFVAFSLDEVATIHEYVGYLSDALLPQGERDASFVSQTGLFFILFGVPFAILLAGLVTAILPFLARYSRARNRIVAGMALMLIAAIGIEALSNLLIPGSPAATLEIAIEEMSEMIGSTLVLWGSVELALSIG
jgi:hypothetical protein